jgi:FkbM family methyltransferase
MPERSQPSELERAAGAGHSTRPDPVFAQFEPWQGTIEAGWDVNFLGVRTRVAYFSMFERLADFSSPRSLQVAPPVQNEDYFEWIDLLESVVNADACFRMIELGAGWGKWLANGAVAARLCGLDYFLVGVEAEPTHFRWMKQHLSDNGVDAAKTDLRQVAVAGEDGNVWFHVGEPADWYGQSVEPDAELRRSSGGRWFEMLRRVSKTSSDRRVLRVKARSLASLLERDHIVDLIDADVQGAEAEVFEAAGDRLTDVVRRAHIGTHSEENEDRLRRLFAGLGWDSVNDYRHGRTNDTPYGPIPFEDGVQTWVNPSLARPAIGRRGTPRPAEGHSRDSAA